MDRRRRSRPVRSDLSNEQASAKFPLSGEGTCPWKLPWGIQCFERSVDRPEESPAARTDLSSPGYRTGVGNGHRRRVGVGRRSHCSCECSWLSPVSALWNWTEEFDRAGGAVMLPIALATQAL